MNIKKFQANTETEAIMLAKEELGKDAVVMNIKTITPKGIYKLFRKKTVEITAAADDSAQDLDRNLRIARKEALKRNPDIMDGNESDIVTGLFSRKTQSEQDKVHTLEEKLNNLTMMLEKQIKDGNPILSSYAAGQEKEEEMSKNLACLRLIYNQMIGNEVEEKYVNQIISEVENSLKKDSSMDYILASIYQKIVLKLGQPLVLELDGKKPKYIFFIGPTGVGKTTTIAKLASKFKVENNIKVAMLTADTYRIAAVEQLNTYAGILGIPLQVVYSEAEMEEARSKFKDYDIVLVDTAGRSHKNRGQRDDIEQLIQTIPKQEREIYLVLSATTKYKDLVQITEAYAEITDYRLIFTKLDETTCIGNIFNIRMLTDAPLSYATFGQSVPNDIGFIDAQSIAKQLLGGQ